MQSRRRLWVFTVLAVLVVVGWVDAFLFDGHSWWRLVGVLGYSALVGLMWRQRILFERTTREWATERRLSPVGACWIDAANERRKGEVSIDDDRLVWRPRSKAVAKGSVERSFDREDLEVVHPQRRWAFVRTRAGEKAGISTIARDVLVDWFAHP